MEEKFCPLTGKSCGAMCGWFDHIHGQCAILRISDSLFPMMMSITGEYPDNPMPRIAENTDVIGAALYDIQRTIENTEFV